MRRRDIEKQFKREAQEHTPDPYDKIVLSAKSEGLLQDDADDAAIYEQGNTAVRSRNKKRLITGCVFFFAAVIACLAIVLPIVLNAPQGIPVSPKGIVLSTNDVYGMGAVSTVKLLGGNTSAQAISKFSAVRSTLSKETASNNTEDEVKLQAEKFNEYFTALDSFMGEEIVTTVSEANTDENYPYDTKLTINSKNFNGEAVQNVMYYTETLLKTEEEDDETESVYTLTGVMVVDGVDYHMEGERSYEQEEGESENELKIRAYADVNDKTNYVEMEQEYSVESGETETEYVYSIYSDGVLVEQTAVEFETEKEGDKEEVEYELEFRKGEAKGRYVVEREAKNGKVEIKVEYNIDGKQGEFRITKTAEGEYLYTFSDGTTAVM